MEIIPRMKKKTLYLDLESLEDRSTLRAPELFLRQHTDKCIILDEIQFMPELFPLLRSLVDRDRKPARFLVLGSANPSISKGASESLAGRIAYLELNPFSINDLKLKKTFVIMPTGMEYPLRKDLIVCGLRHWMKKYLPLINRA